ncbi:TolC family protein [Pontibacter sp. 172403-2]|uniref:TolC family protein n=1 Tax=Pontibacter rufus TaxID=2791028 RepID=UPI0018AFFCE8|nr:TolC family protein [Pontibacter sp. 172403-2]MBF9252236.1 TolC family protein [Pontibacter sp. 172403-2]
MPKRYLLLLLPLLLSWSLVRGQTHVLNYYITTGLQNSPLLQDYQYQVRSNLIDSLKVYATYKPQVSANANAIEAPLGHNFGYDEAITDGGNYTGVVSVTKDLLYGRNRAVQLESIRLLNQSLAAQQKIEAQDLKRVITAQYITAYSDFRQMQFSQQVLDILQKEQPALRKLVQNGVYLQTDYLNLIINIKAQAIAFRQAKIQYKFDLNGLRILCGIVDTGMVILAEPEIQVQNLLHASLTPTLQKFRIDSLQLSVNRNLVDLNYRYKLSAFADAGVMATTPQSIPHHLGTSIGIRFSVPIYDGGQRRLEYQKLAIAEQNRETYRDFYLRQYRMQQMQLRAQLAATDQLIQDIQEQLASQQKLLDMYKVEIAAGLVRFTDFILVITNYTQTQNTLMQAEIGRFQVVNEFNNLK